MSIVDEFTNHLARQFKTLDGVYDRASESAWACPDQRVKGVWQWMAHLLETIEFYLSEQPADSFPWGHRFGLDWEDGQAERIPGKEEMRAYQKDVERFVQQALSSKTDQDLVAPETLHPWTGKLYLGKLLYLLRHTQQHIGDINRALRLNDCQALEWH
jgi:hypothetical protein